MQRSQGLCSVCCPGCTGNPFVPYRCSSKANTEEPGGHIRAGATKTSPELFSVHPIIPPWLSGGILGLTAAQRCPRAGLAQDSCRALSRAREMPFPGWEHLQLGGGSSGSAAQPPQPSQVNPACVTLCCRLGQPGQGWGGSGGPWGGRALCLLHEQPVRRR